MKIYINNEKELLKVDSITEKTRQGTSVLDININNSFWLVDDLSALFSDVQSISIVRTDLNGEEQTVIFTEYTQLSKVQRKITNEIDIMTVTLTKPTSEDLTETE